MSFFGSLLDPIKSLFTPAGTNAARKQQEGQQWFGDFAGQAGKVAGQNWMDALKFNQNFNPQVQSGLTNLAGMTSQSGLRNAAIRGGNYARSQAMSRSVPLQFNTNPLLAQAYQNQQLNTANSQSNQAIQNSTSPQAQSQALQALMQALNGYQQQQFSPFQQAANISFGTPKVQVQPGILDYLGGMAGGMFGKGSVGGGGGNTNYNPTQYQTPIGPNQPPGGTDFSWLNGYNWG